MNIKLKNIIITFSFMIIITGFMVSNILIRDSELSYSERRKLIQFPEFSLDHLLSGDYFNQFDKYGLDQFVLRDEFRSLKALTRLYFLRQMDNNEVYVIDNGIFKMNYPLNEPSVKNFTKKLNNIYELYLNGKNTYYAVIPDKNYFVAKQNGYLAMDYETMEEIIHSNIKNMTYINLFDSLSITDYYRTDIHWSQDKIIDVADEILNQMNQQVQRGEYEHRELFPFYGSYYGQSALPIPPDTLVYLSNEVIENAVVYDYETNQYGKVYDAKRFTGMDSYDVFLSGAKALITIENPNSNHDKELIIFRDSFGSSIVPLLIESYSKITLVDLRYISTSILDEYIDFTAEQDVLFLYSTDIINNSSMLK